MAAILSAPGAAWAASAAISFSGHVPMRNPDREALAEAEVVVGFSDRVLLSVPAIAKNLRTGEIRLQAIDKPGDEAVLHFSARIDGGGAPAFVEVPLDVAGESRYRVCVHSERSRKKQCRAYRIIPAPGIKP